jgi:hypothetical protein
MFLMLLVACSGSSTPVSPDNAYRADAWADNWFAMYIGDDLVMEDSVSITTERSFNAESFGFDAEPGDTLSFILKDFKETDSGLEYIGENNQQMGDGGFIAQITSQTDNEVVLVTSSGWRCLTVHEAPLNKECESSNDPDADCLFTSIDEPEGWKDPGFDDGDWVAATEHTAAAVDPKGGYDDITWDGSAAFIWGADLESHNTLLCRVTLP